jgi:MbtH protein
MTNLLEEENGTYVALINDEGQYSLWPNFIEIPAGWTVDRGPGSRQACLDHINQHCTDMRPRSLSILASATSQRKTLRQE